MVELAALAFLLSIDNVRLASALGLIESARRRWWHLALLMAVVEGGFPLLGAAAGPGLPLGAAVLDRIGPVLLLAAAALSVAGALRKGGLPTAGILYALPMLFALDNLLAGAALRPLGLPATSAALAVGAISGTVSLVSMVAASRLGRRLGERCAWAPGGIALAVGGSLFLFP